MLLTVLTGALQVLVVERPEGLLALPGGLVKSHEAAEQTAVRVLREKAGLRHIYLEQLSTFSDPGRDPRGWIPTVAYVGLVPPDTKAEDPLAHWTSARTPPDLAYDHRHILDAALDRVVGKLWWSNIAVGILPDAFTLGQAREVYEAIAGTAYDPSTFARDLRATALIARTGETHHETGGRPAALYTFSTQSPAWGIGRRKRIST